MKRETRCSGMFLLVVVFSFGIMPTAYGMHIMEGYLPPVYSIAWGIISLPFVAWGCASIRKILREDPKNITLLAMAGAFIFVISSLKIPSVTGSCSHMTGTGLGAILFGPAPVAVLGLIVLLFQALLLAHGGITTLGANLFSMAVMGPLAAWMIYRLCRRWRMDRKISVFMAAFLGDFITYCITGIQLAVAYPAPEGGVGVSAMKFLGIFAPTQLPLAIMEGLLTVMIMIALEAYGKTELKAIGFFKEAG